MTKASCSKPSAVEPDALQPAFTGHGVTDTLSRHELADATTTL